MEKIKYWSELENNFLIKNIFSNPLTITKINLFKMVFDRDGPTIQLMFDLADSLPDVAPIKWGKPFVDFNRCSMGIDCFGVNEVSLLNLKTDMICSIDITKSNLEYYIHCYNNEVNINIKCKNLTLISPRVYMDEQI